MLEQEHLFLHVLQQHVVSLQLGELGDTGLLCDVVPKHPPVQPTCPQRLGESSRTPYLGRQGQSSSARVATTCAGCSCCCAVVVAAAAVAGCRTGLQCCWHVLVAGNDGRRSRRRSRRSRRSRQGPHREVRPAIPAPEMSAHSVYIFYCPPSPSKRLFFSLSFIISHHVLFVGASAVVVLLLLLLRLHCRSRFRCNAPLLQLLVVGTGFCQLLLEHVHLLAGLLLQ
mmetsp:Transcript_33299/g.65397  ORF Transcript_33299/g.65397 Transcript_33299/m.65397 type:complete len:226 (+) Transcript_33299:497-1174(+)